MRVKVKITKFTGGRKHIEVPKVVRDNFEIGEEVFIDQVKKSKKLR